MVNIESIISSVQPTLQQLEPARIAYRAKSKRFGMIVGGIIGTIVIVGLISGAIIPFVIGAVFAGIISGIIYACTIGKESALYIAQFKSAVIPEILRQIDPQLKFEPSRGIDQATFQYSELFSSSPDRYSTEDLVWGQYQETELKLAEIKAEDRRTRTRDGKTETYYVTIFDGLLLIADFHKHFHGRTFVFPDNAESMFGQFGRNFQKMAGRSGTKLAQMEDPEFEKAFAIYSNDAVECRYILSTAMMRRLLDMRNRFGQKDIRIAFKDSSVWIAVPHPKSYLEPKSSTPATDPEQIRRMLSELKSFLDIVEELNLNTRIWSKE